MNFNGFEIVISTLATQPKKWTLCKFQLRPWIIVSDAFRQEMDTWLLQMFGRETELVEYGREPGAYVVDLEAAGIGVGKRLIVHPDIHQILKEAGYG